MTALDMLWRARAFLQKRHNCEGKRNARPGNRISRVWKRAVGSGMWPQARHQGFGSREYLGGGL
jgi:hypothetical protein